MTIISSETKALQFGSAAQPDLNSSDHSFKFESPDFERVMERTGPGGFTPGYGVPVAT